ncbi:nucleotide-binding protein [Thermosipho melanesiensis]|uniref:Nucleotide-binding protein n=1 Tax=Thermosipho melanesiensis TaxID=46541 RepID=A0ABM6GFD8_9BACT|nr:nucleotide-binding protein [Thermosipho melanesiensis]OOC36245.1 nucleotide-binding protein [Thermosipho melanesiensis]OOC37063.1 nucleotide-binding protein [Thermosipho melanesiensis]OOC37815.1 nucleotide-binding protein [Thermosipho melanesiensis]OOC41042.1 nucleotide-binding protein [Thermosipho melanesiensis]
MKNLVVLTGLSGAGKSTALGLLEDMGFYCIDNLPVKIIDQILPIISINIESLALVIDSRSGDIDDIVSVIENMKAKYPVKVIFLNAKDEVLINRFAHTRRNHPLLKEETSLEKAILEERKLFIKILELSDIVVDTSNLNPHQLRERLVGILTSVKKKFRLRILSFGFKYGVPLDVDFIFDVRFFPNPFYVVGLRQKSGKDKEVKNFLYNTQGVKEFLDLIKKVVDFAIQRYENEGRTELSVGIGCTGGQHRSVFFAEELFKFYNENCKVILEHRDVK